MASKNGGFIGTDGLDAPDPPTAVTPTGGDSQLSIAFTAPTDTGTSAITGFVAQVSTDGTNYSGGSNTGSSSPIVVSSLTNGTSYTAKVWAINAYGTSAPSEASSGVAPALPERAFFAGGYASASLAEIDVITITSTGNATDFGDLSEAQYGGSSTSSTTRALIMGGERNLGSVGIGKRCLYFTLSSGGTAATFGNLIQNSFSRPGGCGNSTRALKGGGNGTVGGGTPPLNNIEYFTIASTGDATDFGDLTLARNQTTAASNSTRGIWSGGNDNSASNSCNVLDYVTIASAGNATDFGDLITSYRRQAGAASSTRALWGAGRDAGGINGGTEYSTIASTGNATDFGNLTVARDRLAGTAGTTRAVFGGGNASSGYTNVIDYHTIASTGTGTDFGDLTQAKGDYPMGSSNAHGGLQ